MQPDRVVEVALRRVGMSLCAERIEAWEYFATMGQDNVQLARDLFEQWANRDYDGLMAVSKPDVEIYSRFAALGGEPYRGREGLTRWIAEIEATFGRFDVSTEDFRDLEDSVLILGSIRLKGKGSGIEMDQPMGWLLELEDGKLARMRFYSSHREALEASGLES
jgi:ketosteroid isomerase-like protein